MYTINVLKYILSTEILNKGCQSGFLQKMNDRQKARHRALNMDTKSFSLSL